MSSERERRRSQRCTRHDVAQKAPTSAIFHSRPPPAEAHDVQTVFPHTEAAAASAGEGRLGAAVDAALQEEVLECFCLFDKDGDGLVQVTEVATMLRCLGFVVLAEQVRAFEAEMRTLRTTTIDFKTFSRIANKGFPRRLDPVKVLKAFHLLDRQKKGSVNVEELHHLLTTLGDALTEEDWQKLLNRTLSVRECATPVAMKSGTFFKLICAPVEGESEWSIAAASQQPRAGNKDPLL